MACVYLFHSSPSSPKTSPLPISSSNIVSTSSLVQMKWARYQVRDKLNPSFTNPTNHSSITWWLHVTSFCIRFWSIDEPMIPFAEIRCFQWCHPWLIGWLQKRSRPFRYPMNRNASTRKSCLGFWIRKRTVRLSRPKCVAVARILWLST